MYVQNTQEKLKTPADNLLQFPSLHNSCKDDFKWFLTVFSLTREAVDGGAVS